ncbi:MAG TPA: exopolysaccharide biosynthesis polyprenyl glycosylphosphotransferase [Gaiellaceae bacterium]|nr:exopolysaccharide biosynthesis polyprenyl glycosylphosphotransferase [Gaiellaceae bacterium]
MSHRVRRPRVAPAGGVPATRDLERTLWCLLAAAAVAIGATILTQTTAEATITFSAVALLLALAAATLRAIATLTPPMLRARRTARVAVVGSSTSADRLRDDLREADVAAIDVVGAISPEGAAGDFALGSLADLRAVVDTCRLDVLLVGSDDSRARVVEAVMRTCEGDAVRVYALSAFYEDVFGHVPITEVDDAWLQYVLHPRFRERRSQRIFDVVVAGALAVVFLPLIACMALLIRRDRGPALFRQQRIGRDGRRFVIYKLRTMRWEPGSEARWASEGDPRITPVGRFLRRTHLDELPQLINVLRGDMTLVGPRPEQPEIVESLEGEQPLWRGRHRYKPGLTGWAQVRCGYGGSHDGSALKLANDLYYLRHQSLALDMAILAQTAITALSPPRRDEDVVVPFVLPPAQEPTARRGDADRRPRAARFVSTWRTGATRALVTGGAGFIGSQLVDRLVEDGFDVVALDDLSAGRTGNLAQAFGAGARLETADVTCAEDMRRLFIAHRPEVVFHLAAQIAVSRAVEEPLMDATANVVGTLSVLEAARACGAQRLVLASSGGAIYGDALVKPTPEHAPLVPLSPYGTAKLAAEQYTALYNDLYGLSTATLRLANVYGPRQGLGGEGGVIARFCRALVDGEPAQVFGDGLQTRDYVHVRDVVAAFAAAGHSQASGAFNIGTGTETTLLDLLEALDWHATFHEARSGEVRRSSLDATAAARELGWHACTPLVDGLAETLAFAREAWATRIAV